MKNVRYMTLLQCAEIFEKYGVRSKEAQEILGSSPGGAAAELGVSRQRTHQLVAEGKLDMVILRDNDDSPATSWIITDASIKRYRLSKGGVQQSLPLSKPRGKVGLRTGSRSVHGPSR